MAMVAAPYLAISSPVPDAKPVSPHFSLMALAAEGEIVSFPFFFPKI